MKSKYKRKSWYLDDGILLEGYCCKRVFYPNNFGCGFEMQGFTKKMINKEIFFSLKKAIEVCGNVEIAR